MHLTQVWHLRSNMEDIARDAGSVDVEDNTLLSRSQILNPPSPYLNFLLLT